ncbi:MAG: IS1380 family transposase [Gammaproteobacteria bacterium]|nr:IS1380 family transposase [Gammaproteobacteria bacterium]
MTECTQSALEFPGFSRRRIEASFDGGDISGNGGAQLLRLADDRTRLIRSAARAMGDARRQKSCAHDLESLIRQRVYAMILGHEDLNDHDELRSDLALRTALHRDETLASPSTLCRLENRADRATAAALHEVLVERFIASFARAPRRLVLDVDATDDRAHGAQEGRFFHGYYDHYCFLPLYVFCGDRLLASYLRPSKIDGAKHSWAVLALLVRRLRRAWPEVRITVRGDSGFCRWRMLRWFDRHGVDYVIGVAKNARLLARSSQTRALAQRRHRETGDKQRLFGEIRYGARSWDAARRVIVKAEHGARGGNPRFVVTSLGGDPQRIYDRVYCARGDMENRIKEQQLDLFADRTSCHKWWANQFRLLLSSLAYTLLETIRRTALRGTALARAQCGTLRLKLLRIGAVVLRNTRRVRLLLSSSYPHPELFLLAAARLKPD